MDTWTAASPDQTCDETASVIVPKVIRPFLNGDDFISGRYLSQPEYIIDLGERAARAFSDLPMLGVDILQDAISGRLFVVEVNALGHNWNFGKRFRKEFGLDVTDQFDGLRKAAYILAEQTQKLANPDQRMPGS